MDIRKAVITAAAKNQRSIPLQQFVDRDGVAKSALQILIEEALSTNVEEIAIVIHPGDRDAYAAAAGEHAHRLHFVEQSSPRGYGHALLSARSFTENQPFLHLVSDHLALSHSDRRCAQQLVEVATAADCAVSAVTPTHESMLPYFGTVRGVRVPQRKDLYEIETVIEKPTPTQAEQSLIIPGLRAGYYLCLFGMHVLTPTLMQLLGELDAKVPAEGRVVLSPALAELPRRERYLALEVKGRRHDLAGKYGLLFAQLALALAGQERSEVLAGLVNLLAARELNSSTVNA